ncbi:MAG: D-alanine--D-alanine ligase [Desulfobacteraceae bacterium]|nr:MAG: D-alanine--D-alanine ligase [Desulfobacteraceae bacterium]
MRVGITYDLRKEYLALGMCEEETAEFDKPETIDAVAAALKQLGYAPEKIGNIRALAERLVAGDRWDLVFNIAEGLRGFGREAQVPALLDAYDIPYTFSDPLVLALTLHKGMTKRVIRDLGIPTPDFAVVEEEAEAGKVDLPFPLFAKPVAEGTGKGISGSSKIESRAELVRLCGVLLREFRQPVLIETYLPGREFTVGITGTGKEARALAVIEVILKGEAESHAYSYVNKQRFEELVEYRLVKDGMAEKAAEVALAAYKGLGCADAGRVDLRADRNGLPQFMEINPLAGLHPEDSDLPILNRLAGFTYLDLIGKIVASARARVGR